MIGKLFGSTLLEYLGASIRWIILAIWSISKGKKVKSLHSIFKGNKKDEQINRISYGLSNILIGYAVIIISALLILFC
jgi:hypothetical protein